MTKHTKGPWILNVDTVHIPRHVNGVAVSVQPVAYHMDSQGMADARLIAAAPELLAALERLVDRAQQLLGDGQTCGALKQARAAIAKATGK